MVPRCYSGRADSVGRCLHKKSRDGVITVRGRAAAASRQRVWGCTARSANLHWCERMCTWCGCLGSSVCARFAVGGWLRIFAIPSICRRQAGACVCACVWAGAWLSAAVFNHADQQGLASAVRAMTLRCEAAALSPATFYVVVLCWQLACLLGLPTLQLCVGAARL